jgi:hypothetical protein
MSSLGSRRVGVWAFALTIGTILVCLPFIRIVHSLGPTDEAALLYGADRMLRGEAIYRDFFEFLPPGGFMLLYGWFDWTGVSLPGARAFAIGCLAGIAALTFLASHRASGRTAVPALLTLQWVVATQGHADLGTQVSHHWLTTLFSILAAYATLDTVARASRWCIGPAWAGLAGGAAAMVVPTRGAAALVAAAASLLDGRRYRLEFAALVMASAVVPGALVIYLLGVHALGSAIDDVIVFTARQYLSVQGVPYARGVTYQNYPLKYLFPLAGLLAAVYGVVNWRASWRDPTFRTCVAFALSGVVGFLPRPDMAHIGFCAPLACPLLAYCICGLTRAWSRLYSRALAVAIVALCLPTVPVFAYFVHLALAADAVETPRGRITLASEATDAKATIARIAATPAGDTYLFYPYLEMLAFLTAREQVSPFVLFIPQYTLPSQYKRACESTMRRADWALIDRRWSDARTLKEAMPAIRDANPPEKRAFERAVETAFEFVARDGVLELRQRSAAADPRLCSDIDGVTKTPEE